MRGNGIEVPFAEFAVLGFALLKVKVVDVVPLVVVDLLAVVQHELGGAWFGVLAGDSADYDGFLWAGGFYDILALGIELDLIYVKCHKKSYFRALHDAHAQRVPHNPLHAAPPYDSPHTLPIPS